MPLNQAEPAKTEAQSPSKMSKMITKVPEFKSEIMKHDGWIEGLKNEEKTMKDSIKRCIEGGYTRDPDRAKQILKFQFPDSEDESGHNEKKDWEPKGLLGQKEYHKQRQPNQEVLMESNMIKIRPDFFPLEFLLPKNGKKFQKNTKGVRALQSKISLKFPLAALEKEKVRQKPEIKQSIIDDFERTYAHICDKDRQRKKNRNVSVDSFFDPNNKVPVEYLRVDPSFLEKPGKIDITRVDPGNRKLAGRLTEIGEQILKIGSQKAKFICTGNWDNMFVEKKGSSHSSYRPSFTKVTSFDAQNYVERPKK